MIPIVNGFEVEFFGEVRFRYLNATDGAAGQQAFAFLRLPGHPAILIFSPEGEEVYRAFGVVEDDILQDAISNVLNGTGE
jgi:hypothetical protein